MRARRRMRSCSRYSSLRVAIGRRTSSPTAHSGCWGTRLALPPNPRGLPPADPAPGVPPQESAELFSVIANLSQEIAVLFIEHDMNVVFRFAHRIIVMVGGRILLQGTPKEIAADARVREVYLGGAHHG